MASQAHGNQLVVNGGIGGDLSYHEKLNSDPDRLRFAYVRVTRIVRYTQALLT